jgi:hypothetical protein
MLGHAQSRTQKLANAVVAHDLKKPAHFSLAGRQLGNTDSGTIVFGFFFFGGIIFHRSVHSM